MVDHNEVWEGPEWALAHYRQAVAADAPVRSARNGLLNHTYAVGAGPDHTLQLVAPQFGDDVIRLIGAVGPVLTAHGIAGPQVIATDDGALSVPVPDGRRWRLFNWLPGKVHDRPPSAEHAREAAALLARFHDSLQGQPVTRDFCDNGFHDTNIRMGRLASVLGEGDGEVRAIARAILDAWTGWRKLAPPDVPMRPGHGDPKFSNFVFPADSPVPVGIIDFDTLGLYRLDDDLGDAIRSWCNAADLDASAAQFDETVFRATVAGYLGSNRGIAAAERERIVHGGVRITLELAARFCTDAVEQSYFHWDAAVAPDARTHNLWRAAAQLDLAQQMIAKRGHLEAAVRTAVRPEG